MNSVPIIAVKDLSTDSFSAGKKGIDLKLSSISNNGLKLTPNGLIYSSGNGNSANPRTLLGAFEGTTSKTYNFNNEVDINLRVRNLGSDENYLYFGLDSVYELKLSSHAHQDATTYGQEDWYGTSFSSTYWGDPNQQQTITYTADGVVRTLMLSYVRLNGVFYVWCDIVCVEPVNFIGLNPTSPNDGSITNNE